MIATLKVLMGGLSAYTMLLSTYSFAIVFLFDK